MKFFTCLVAALSICDARVQTARAGKGAGRNGKARSIEKVSTIGVAGKTGEPLSPSVLNNHGSNAKSAGNVGTQIIKKSYSCEDPGDAITKPCTPKAKNRSDNCRGYAETTEKFRKPKLLIYR